MEGLGLYISVTSLWILAQKLAKDEANKNKKGVNTCSVSAPGKALIAGGYLVLEKENVGITVAATSRFFSTVTILEAPSKRAPTGIVEIVVESPQFHTCYIYKYHYRTNILVSASSFRNEFVEKCLNIVLSFILIHLGLETFVEKLGAIEMAGKIGIKLRADNDFYSQIAELKSLKKPLTSEHLKELPRFSPCRLGPNGHAIIEKTGMGSSAAMTTSLVGSLLQWFGIIRLGSRCGEEDRRILHNLAQLSHGIAQGKIGSGFDVAAAVYGTQLYQRFDADNFSACMDGHATSQQLYAAVTTERLWTQKIIPFSLPPGIEIMMGDVCAGSSSTSMAKEVLRWKGEEAAAATALWSSLAAINRQIFESIQRLSQLSKADPEAFYRALQFASTVVFGSKETMGASDESSKDSILAELRTLHNLNVHQRQHLRSMGEQAGVGIEPPQQTALLDATLQTPGVITAGVPGAGGVDAVFTLVIGTATVRNAVETVWSTWGGNTTEIVGSVCPLLLSADVGINAGVRAEFELGW